MSISAPDFNQAAERYYREDLRRSYLSEALGSILGECRADSRRMRDIAARSMDDEATVAELSGLIRSVLSVIYRRAHESFVVDERACAGATG